MQTAFGTLKNHIQFAKLFIILSVSVPVTTCHCRKALKKKKCYRVKPSPTYPSRHTFYSSASQPLLLLSRAKTLPFYYPLSSQLKISEIIPQCLRSNDKQKLFQNNRTYCKSFTFMLESQCSSWVASPYTKFK